MIYISTYLFVLDRLESLITWIRRLQMKSPSVQTDAMLVQWPYGILLIFLSSIDPCIILKEIKSCALQIMYRSDFGQRYKKLNPWSFANWTTTKVFLFIIGLLFARWNPLSNDIFALQMMEDIKYLTPSYLPNTPSFSVHRVQYTLHCPCYLPRLLTS